MQHAMSRGCSISITGYARPTGNWNSIAVSPVNLRSTLARAHRTRDSSLRERGQFANIWLKMNALVDPEIIDALYKASQKGVTIELIVRAVSLRPEAGEFRARQHPG